MGQVHLRDLHEEIRKHIKDLKEGDISGVIEAQASFYIFRIMGKEVHRTKSKKAVVSVSDISEEERQELTRELQEKEIADSIESWVREAKDRAYIEVVSERK
jgi:parvulin-like peptidyl-prolyl isomerase